MRERKFSVFLGYVLDAFQIGQATESARGVNVFWVISKSRVCTQSCLSLISHDVSGFDEVLFEERVSVVLNQNVDHSVHTTRRGLRWKSGRRRVSPYTYIAVRRTLASRQDAALIEYSSTTYVHES